MLKSLKERAFAFYFFFLHTLRFNQLSSVYGQLVEKWCCTSFSNGKGWLSLNIYKDTGHASEEYETCSDTKQTISYKYIMSDYIMQVSVCPMRLVLNFQYILIFIYSISLHTVTKVVVNFSFLQQPN